MRIIAQALRFRTSVLVFTVLIVAAGFWSYATLPKEASPSIVFPVVTVTTIYPGAAPDEVEALVTFPVERELQGLDGLDELRSTSREGVSIITAEFRTDVDREEAARRVRERVDLARPELPADAEEPVVREIDFEELPILAVNLVASYPLAQLKRVAERLQDEIEGVAGVTGAELTGGVEREVQVNVDLVALHARGVTFDDVARAIEQENVSLPGGTIEADRLAYQVRVDGRIAEPGRIADLIVAVPGDRPVFVRDVAEIVAEGYADPTSIARLREVWTEDERGRLRAAGNGRYEEAITLSVRARAGENIIETVAAVERVVQAYDLPPGTRVVLTGDRSETVREFVEELENHIIFGVLLVTLSLLFFLGLRTALLAAASIPLTLLLTFIVFRVAGETLNFIILFSLIIVLGILVDFAIIVVENLERRGEGGDDRWESVRAATAEVAWPVTAGLATTAAVFVPLLFWGGLTGEFLRYIPITLIVTLGSALVVALVIIPVLAGYAQGGGRTLAGRRRAKLLLVGLAAALVLMLLLANPIAALVVVVSSALLWALYRYALAPGTDWFRSRALPRAEAAYGRYLQWALVRDYGADRALVRNGAVFVAGAAGVALLAAGALAAALLGFVPALVLLAPGAILLGLAILGVLALFVETLLVGGRATLIAGIVLGALLLPAAVVNLLRGTAVVPLLAILAVPATLLLLGFIGMRRPPRRRIATDNRARVLALTFGSVVLVIGLLVVASPGTAFFPDTDPNQVVVELEAPAGTRLDVSRGIAETATARIESLMRDEPRVARAIRNIVVNVGVGGEAEFLRGQPEARRTRITLNLVNYPDRAESSTRTLERLRAALDPLPGATVRFDQDRPGPPVEPPVQIEVSGPEFTQVAAIATDIETRLREAIDAGRLPGLVDLASDLERGQPVLRVHVDRQRAALFGVSTQAVAATVGAAVQGRVAGTIREAQDEYDIRIRLREEDRATLRSLEALRIGAVAPAASGNTGTTRQQEQAAQVPLSAVAEIEVGTGVGAITRLDQRPLVTIEANAAPGFGSSEVLAATQRELAGVRDELPPGYTLRYAGEVEEQQEEFGFLAVALLFGMALILLVLVSKFNSIMVPLLILLAIALTLLGVAFGLVATRTAFSLFTFLGVISLAGIVADDDIVMAEFIRNEEAAGRSADDAVVAGASSRFRQVTLTAVTTMLGLIPLTFGLYVDFRGLLTELRPAFQLGSQNTQFWGPLGGAIIVGLPFATAVTLLVVPVAWSAMHSARRHAARLLSERDHQR